jgi:hypothetical protein
VPSATASRGCHILFAAAVAWRSICVTSRRRYAISFCRIEFGIDVTNEFDAITYRSFRR